MTNNQLTKEWLQQTISELESVRDEIPFGIDTNSELELAAFKLALAAMDSEPVAYWRKALRADGFCYADGINSKRFHDDNPPFPLEDGDYWEIIPLYRHAQPAPVVPEEMTPQQASRSYGGEVSGYRDGWNACRAAMLQPLHTIKVASALGSLPKTGKVLHANSPVIPDTWIPVSERMPGSQEWVIVFAKWANQQILCWDDAENRWTDFEDQSYHAAMFTHWMPLPAATKEVK